MTAGGAPHRSKFSAPARDAFLPFAAPVAAWRRLPKRWRQLAVSLLIGVAIEFALHHLGAAGWRRDLENVAMDGMMRLANRAPLFSGSTAAAGYTFLDINEATFESWGQPFFTERDRLMKLIEFAARGRARLIIVDVELTRRTGPRDTLSEEDTRLAKYLHSYAGPAPIVLVRMFKPGEPAAGCRDSRTSFLEQSEFKPSSGVHWAAVNFVQENDLSIRRWRLWQRACGGAEPDYVPSVQLLTAAYLKYGAGSFDRLHNAFQRFARDCQDCEQSDHEQACLPLFDSSPALELDDKWKLRAGESRVAQRIIYSIPWTPTENERQGWPLVKLQDGSETPILTRFAAEQIASPEEQGPPPEVVAGRVVVIGGSFADSGDIYATPFGPMPGAMILINAIQSLTKYGQLRPPPCLLEYALLIVLILLMGWLFARRHHLRALLVSGGSIIALMLPLSFWMFKHGRWLDFALPLVVVLLHNLAAEFEEALEHRHATGAEKGE